MAAARTIAAEYDRFRVVKLQRHCPADRARAILPRARAAWAGGRLDLTDGVKVRLDDGWFILRASNTEPIVRVIALPPAPSCGFTPHHALSIGVSVKLISSEKSIGPPPKIRKPTSQGEIKSSPSRISRRFKGVISR